MQRPLRQRICRCEVHIGAAQGLQLIMDALCLAHMLRCLPQERSRRVPRKVQRVARRGRQRAVQLQRAAALARIGEVRTARHKGRPCPRHK